MEHVWYAYDMIIYDLFIYWYWYLYMREWSLIPSDNHIEHTHDWAPHMNRSNTKPASLKGCLKYYGSVDDHFVETSSTLFFPL